MTVTDSYLNFILSGTGDTGITTSIARTDSAGNDRSSRGEKSLAKDMLRVKGRTILQMRRKMTPPVMSDSVSDSSTMQSIAASNIAGIADPPLYFSRQYSSQRRASPMPDQVPPRSSPVMIKIVAPILPVMVDKETNTEDKDDEPPVNIAPNPLQLGSYLDDAETVQSTLDVSAPGTAEPKNEGDLSVLSLGTSTNEKKKPKSSESKKGKDIKLLKPVHLISATRTRKEFC